MPNHNPEIDDHKSWLGYLQPEGLVVSAQALADSGVQIDRGQIPQLQEKFKELVTNIIVGEDETKAGIGNLNLFCEHFLGWLPTHMVGDQRPEAIPDDLILALPDFDETISPTLALRRFEKQANTSPWVLLVQKISNGQDLDKNHAPHSRGWEASPTKKFERLLRDTKIHVGIITNGTHFRLVYAPAKENSGNITFPVQAMTEVGGRLILGAFHMLLRAQCVLNAPDKQHIHKLLAISREYQASVSTQLAEQVLFALYELLRGFQSAHDVKGKVLDHPLRHNPNQIYEGLLTVLLRLVFLLFAEDRGLMPGGRVYSRHYSIHGLFEKLRADNDKYADQMEGRYGAWPRLLALFRIVYTGCKHSDLIMPARHGHLFDPERFPFLEGREPNQQESPDNLPMVSDGTFHRVLQNLMLLSGERISYRTLDVEEIGSVYQTIMGFGILVSPGTTIALRGKSKKGSVPAAPVIVLEDLLAQPAKDRTKWLKEKTDHAITGEADKQLKAAATIEDVLAILGPRMDRNASQAPIPKGKLALQPTDERRRSGSHYTPRSFTEPIVRKTLRPILKRFGLHPTVEQILSLKIADIAVGSAAFLVEVCRQLADWLIKAWQHHGNRPNVPPDETEELLAMRIIAQRCIYGVDRNPMAVDLAKLSLWLATLAKDHPFTFLDHSIRCGDSLVGLTRKQIECFHWDEKSTDAKQILIFAKDVAQRTNAALREREALIALSDDQTSPQLKQEKLKIADERLQLVRDIGDAAIAAFFSSEKPKDREIKRMTLADGFVDWLQKGDVSKRPTKEIQALRNGEFPVTPFHWEIEFPEVFFRDNPGFDGIVGNPPFAGKNTLSTGSREGYQDWLKVMHDESHGNADLVAHFFRRAFNILRQDACFGLIATNTIGQGDTRATGLQWICTHGGTIYAARKRHKWPGQAAVIISVVWAAKGSPEGPFDLDGNAVSLITAYLFHAGGHQSPSALIINHGKSYQGPIVLGMGFTFDDSDTHGIANTLNDMRQLIANNLHNAERIFAYIGGEEVLNDPTHTHRRYVINFGEMTENEAQKWPELYAIIEQKVKPVRLHDNRESYRRLWWQFAEKRSELMDLLTRQSHVLMHPFTSSNVAFARLPATTIIAGPHNIILDATDQCFSVLQCRLHEFWARFFASSMKDDLRYTPSDCFETFPFPTEFESNPTLEKAGQDYYEFRAALMQDLWLGLTATYNLFHAPDSEAIASLQKLYSKRRITPDWKIKDKVPEDKTPMTLYPTPEKAMESIRKLRELHAKMDGAVLRAYGWHDLAGQANCEFLLDYEEEEDGDDDKGGRQRKKPWRFRWPDEFRDEVLARLLKLNAERAEQEKILAQATSPKPTAKKPKKPKSGDNEQLLNL